MICGIIIFKIKKLRGKNIKHDDKTMNSLYFFLIKKIIEDNPEKKQMKEIDFNHPGNELKDNPLLVNISKLETEYRNPSASKFNLNKKNKIKFNK